MQGQFGLRAPQRRRRALVWSALALLLLVGVVLGLVMPGKSTTIELGGASLFPDRDSDAPILVASEYHETSTTIWLLSADHPASERSRLVNIPHAAGWDIEAAAAHDERAVAVLTIPPDGWDPLRHAVLLRVDESGVRPLASGLELHGGVRWSDDDERLVVRRDGALSVLDASNGAQLGAWRPSRAGAAEAIAMRGDTLWAAFVGADGTSAVRLELSDRGLEETERRFISDTSTRDWTLSPDSDSVAFTEQRGGELSVRVASLTDAGSQRWVSAKWAEAPAPAPSASPVWRPDGGLDHGTWQAGVESFTLPLSWHSERRMAGAASAGGRRARQRDVGAAGAALGGRLAARGARRPALRRLVGRVSLGSKPLVLLALLALGCGVVIGLLMRGELAAGGARQLSRHRRRTSVLAAEL